MRRRHDSNRHPIQALAPLLGYLRRGGLAPEPVLPEPSLGRDRLLARFGDYLSVERAPTALLVRAHRYWVRPFVEQVVDVSPGTGSRRARGGGRAAVLDCESSTIVTEVGPDDCARAAIVSGFLATSRNREGVADRSYLGSGAPEAPATAQGLTAKQVDSLLDACLIRGTPPDAAIVAAMVCLHRLGRRRGEATGLARRDIHWGHASTARARRHAPATGTGDVGQTAHYLRHGRPDTSSRTVFVRAYAPFTAMAPSTLSRIGPRRRPGRVGMVHAPAGAYRGDRRVDERASLDQVCQPLRHATRHHGDLRQDRPEPACRVGAAVAHHRRHRVSGLEQMVADYLRLHAQPGIQTR